MLHLTYKEAIRLSNKLPRIEQTKEVQLLSVHLTDLFFKYAHNPTELISVNVPRSILVLLTDNASPNPPNPHDPLIIKIHKELSSLTDKEEIT